MKKGIALCLTLAILLLWSCAPAQTQEESSSWEESCQNQNESSSEGKEVSSESSSTNQEPSSQPTENLPQTDEKSKETTEDNTPAPITYPHVIGDFMQPAAFASYTEEEMITHLKDLQEVGIELVILQWSFVSDAQCKATLAYFPAGFEKFQQADSYQAEADFMEILLAAAQKVGIKIFLGLNQEADWWANSKDGTDKAWLEAFTDLGLSGAKQLYDHYKKKYPDAFYGWYFTPEYCNKAYSDEQLTNIKAFTKNFRQGLFAIDDKMPFLISPFIISPTATDPFHTPTTAKETETMWKHILAGGTLKKGDILACQDTSGSGHTPLEELGGYFKAIRNAIDAAAPEIHFWANCESFQYSESGSADLNRLVQQMEITEKYVEAHITFSYSHYLSPSMGKDGQHAAYKHYYQTGSLPKPNLSAPDLNVTTKSGGIFAELSVSLPNTDQMIRKVIIEKDGSVIHTALMESDFDKATLSLVLADSNLNSKKGDKVTYSVYAVDYCGNKSPVATASLILSRQGAYNAALGKKYTATGLQDAYPDEGGSTLTDGVYATNLFTNPAWNGFLGNPEIVIDLGERVDNISAFSFSALGSGAGAGILAPASLTAYVSDDGITFTPVVTAVYPAEANTMSSATLFVRYAFPKTSVSGRYVKLTFTAAASWMFVDEVAVIALP